MKLYQAKTEKEQKDWILQALQKGRVLTDPALWLAGVDDPFEVMRSLRREGRDVKTCRATVRDAAGENHRVTAWKL